MYFFALIVTGCVEPFDPPVRESDVNYLVVDGFVNTTAHSANIRLSRALPLSTVSAYPVELNATVSIEESGGATYSLQNLNDGNYHLDSDGFVSGKQYRLRISTNGSEYLSDYVVAKVTPEIDSVTWTGEADGVNIKVSTHDAGSNTDYYRWEYLEDWEYNAPYSSDWKLEGGRAVYRPIEEQIFTCYNRMFSSKISIFTTSGLIEDRVSNFELALVPQFSQKISRHYSILVKQYALSKSSFDYWQQLKVTTEELGSLFDPQPARVKGNVKNVSDENEPVIGYFDASDVTEKRLFIAMTDLPVHLRRFPTNFNCSINSTPVDSVYKLPAHLLITNAIYVGPTIIGFNYTSMDCADCRVQGGITTKPDFWPW